MKFLTLKLFIIFICIFSTLLVENVYIRNNFISTYEHISALKLTDKKYIRAEQSADSINENSFFIEKNQLRLHKLIHEDEDSVFICEENGNTKCYVSALSINTNNRNEYLKNTILKGRMPENEKEIVINQNLAKRLNLSINDSLVIKSPLIYQKVKICGIMINFYGFPDFKKDSFYYCLINNGKNYANYTKGAFFTFSNNKENAFTAEIVKDKLNKQFKKIKTNSISIFIIIFLIECLSFQVYSKTLCLKKNYLHLKVIGKDNLYIQKQKFSDVILFFSISFFIVVLVSMLGLGLIFVLFNFAAILLSSIINFFWSK